jgi:hypothetical protein
MGKDNWMLVVGIGVVDAVNIGTQVRNISLSVRTTRTTDNICTAMLLLAG